MTMTATPSTRPPSNSCSSSRTKDCDYSTDAPEPTADEASWTSLSPYIVPRTYPWCGKYKGQRRAKRIGKRRKVCQHCRKRDCADPCGAKRETDWFDEARAHLDAMRPYGPFYLVEAVTDGPGPDWGQLQRKYLRGTRWWHCSIPTPFGRRAITNRPDIPGAVEVAADPEAVEEALLWVYAQFDLGPSYGEGRKGKRPRDNFEALQRVATALYFLFNGGPGPEPPAEPDPEGPWLDDEKGSGVPVAKALAILDSADPPVPYEWRSGHDLTFDITGHPQEAELGVRLRLPGYGWRFT